MGKSRDITGQTFNGLTAIKHSHKDNGGRSHWIFRCHCGKHFTTQGYKVTSGHTKSCGCVNSVNRPGYAEEIRQKILDNVEIDANECWNWTKSLKSTGYAQIVAYGKGGHGHRVSYKVFRGDFDETLFVCHKCDNRRCMNPDHLFLGTAKDNHLDMMTKGRNRPVTHEKHHRAKLTKDDVMEARKIYFSGEHGCSVLAKRYGVTSRTIWCAINGITWKNIDGEK